LYSLIYVDFKQIEYTQWSHLMFVGYNKETHKMLFDLKWVMIDINVLFSKGRAHDSINRICI